MMLCTSKSQLSPSKRVQRRENQNQFLQARHGDKEDMTPETILVGLRHNEDGFELLSWAISIAARPGDTVIVFRIHCDGVKANNSINTRNERAAVPMQLNALKDLCKIKQVHLDAKFATCGIEEHELIEEAASRFATMLVLSPSSRHELRNIQKTGSMLVQRVHSGCSIVIVKDYKVVFCNNNVVKETKNSSHQFSEEANRAAPILRSKSLNPCFPTLQRQISRKLSSTWPHESDGLHEQDINISTANKVWPVYTGEDSPRGVLDGPGLSSESEISSPSCSGSSLPHSLSKKGLLSCVSSQDDDEVVSQYRSQSALKLRRHGSIKRLSTFPPPRCLKKLPGSMDCTSMKSSFKSYINTLQSTESMSHDPFTPVPNMQTNWRSFSYEELAIATDFFNPDNMVGNGGHSEVFKGVLQDGRLVAIKRLRKGGSEEVKEKDFLTELGIIGHVSHPNTIPLLGFCVEEGLHLIFNFSFHGSLATLLHGVNAPLLDWPSRYKVAVGTARGLHYLHTACPRRIIHRDIKASNILLGPDFEPQISDFGLAKWLPEQWTQLSVFPVEGTFGYLAPEYFMHGVIHEKTDVFAFGVLLLELITGQQPINKSQQSLVIWAKPLLESMQIKDLADPRLAGEYDHGEMQAMVKIAAMCVHNSSTCRPLMGQVLEMFTGENSESTSKLSATLEHYQDSSEEYSSTSYLSDLSRHREIALQF